MEFEATKALQKGDIIIYPTDTLYAFGADIFNEKAIQKIFSVKHRPANIPLPVAVADAMSLNRVGYTNQLIMRVVERFLPGPLTIVMKKKEEVPAMITAGFPTIAVRIPRHPIALNLLTTYGPLTVTSANVHGEETLGNIFALQQRFGDVISVYLDGGTLTSKPSTIVDLTGDTPKIIRQGNIGLHEIQDAIADE